MSLNAVHNILNLLIGVAGALLAADWTMLAAFGITPQQVGVFIGALGLIKLVANAVRDGLAGMFKEQPPVADKVTTVVVASSAGAEVDVTKK